jgi:hypothetical protein
VFGKRLHDAYGETVFGMIEPEDAFVLAARFTLLPVKKLFDLRMTDDSHTLVIVDKPLNDIRQRRGVNLARPRVLKRRRR